MNNNNRFTRDSDKRFTLRIDAELFKLIESSARKSKRAIGREIEFILEQHFDNAGKE